MELEAIERVAAAGENCPALLMTEEKLFFEVMQLLYRHFGAGQIDKGQAAVIKKRIYAYACDLIRQRTHHWADCKRWESCEMLLTDARKEGCSICKQIEAVYYDTGDKPEKQKEDESTAHEQENNT